MGIWYPPVRRTGDSKATSIAELREAKSKLKPVSGLIQDLEKDSKTPNRLAALTHDAISSRLTSKTSISRQTKHIDDLARCAKIHLGSVCKVKGEIAAFVIRDCLLQARRRGHSAPIADKAALSTWSDSLKIDWDFADRHIKSAVSDLSSHMMAQGPPYPLGFLTKLETLAG